MRHIACVHLKNWPVNRFKRRQQQRARIRHAPSPPDRPLAIVESIAGRPQTIVAACRLAQARGIRTGMTLAEARARCAELADAPHQPDRDRRALEALGRWMMRFTPAVQIADGDDALLLDVSGCERLFGDWRTLLSQAYESLHGLRIAARIVLAPTAGAARALALSRRTLGWHIVDSPQVMDVLEPLPIESLRLDADACERLRRVGVITVGQLRRLPRESLPARFGSSVLRRLDEAFGTIDEPLAPLDAPETIRASIEFEYSIDALEAIWDVVRELLDRVVDDLSKRAAGARELRLRFGRLCATPVEQTVSLARPSRQAKAMFNLIRCALESLQTDQGFNSIALEVSRVEPLAMRQTALHGNESTDTRAARDGLVERLHARLGHDGIVRPRWVESHVPERACVFESALTTVGQAFLPVSATGRSTSRSPRRSRPAADDRQECLSHHQPAQVVHDAKPLSPRPLCLFAMPIEIRVTVSPSEDREGRPIAFTHHGRVRRLPISVGPERIAGQWWEGSRDVHDYFEVEDETGERFWIFRVLPTWRWYLHGAFG